MTVRLRLVLTIVGIAALLVVPAMFSLSRLRVLDQIASEQRHQHGGAYFALGELQTRLAELDRLQRTYLITPDAQGKAQLTAALDGARRSISDLRDAGYGAEARLAAAWVDSLTRATAWMEGLMAAGQREEASQYFIDSVQPSYDRANQVMRQIGQEIDARSSRDLELASRITNGAIGGTLLALGICALVAFAFGAWTTRELTTPIMRLRDSMALVAGGDLRVQEILPYGRGDEIGSLSRSFRAMTHRLAELDRMKAEFMSISTHELKTPINVISGYAELMQERVYGDVTEKQEEALLSIREQSRVLTQLVNQLLDLSRLEAGGLRLHMQELVLRDLFRRVQRSFEALATKKNITLTVEVDDGVPLTVMGDADRLADQVLGNLISNALKFTPEGGHISVRAWRDDAALVIEVEDTGSGIPGDQLPYIFDKFYQVGEQARSKGAGLGLAIASEVVTAHGGSITATSEQGRGTTFRITLPAAAEEPSSSVPVPHHVEEATR